MDYRPTQGKKLYTARVKATVVVEFNQEIMASSPEQAADMIDEQFRTTSFTTYKNATGGISNEVIGKTQIDIESSTFWTTPKDIDDIPF